MATKHKLRTFIPVGDPDEGAEVEVEIAFNFIRGRPAVYYLRNGDPGYPADPAEIEFIGVARLCNGKPAPYGGLNGKNEQTWLEGIAEDWFYSDEGEQAAFEAVQDDDEAAREYAAEAKRDERWEQP
jgi:hypothetical protein